jgi:hypothetical protein
VLGALALKWERPAFCVASATLFGLMGYYLSAQFGLPAQGAWVAGGLTGLLGGLFACLCRRAMVVTLTSLQGVLLIIVGFVTVSTCLVPEIGLTFRQWASSQAVVVPVFLAMLFATAYSYQAMHQQGDIRTGR